MQTGVSSKLPFVDNMFLVFEWYFDDAVLSGIVQCSVLKCLEYMKPLGTARFKEKQFPQ